MAFEISLGRYLVLPFCGRGRLTERDGSFAPIQNYFAERAKLKLQSKRVSSPVHNSVILRELDYEARGEFARFVCDTRSYSAPELVEEFGKEIVHKVMRFEEYWNVRFKKSL
jgi:hypothetical protein